jgi:hypothetical protein
MGKLVGENKINHLEGQRKIAQDRQEIIHVIGK